MSLKSAKELLEKMQNDRAFRDDILAKGQGPEREGKLQRAGFEPFQLTDDEAKDLMQSVKDEEALNVVRVFHHKDLGCGW